jgi:hypothetical protein
MFKFQIPFLCAFVLIASSIQAADSEPKDEVIKAAKALAEKGSYSWRTTVTVPPDARFRPGPTEGKIEKDATYLKMNVNDNTSEAVLKGKSFAFKGQDGDWQSATDVESAEGPARFMAGRLRSFKAPAEQAQDIVKDVKELKKEGEVYAGDLTEEGAKNLLRFRRGSGDGPQITNAKGSAKFWLKDGVLSKLEYKVSGSMNFNGNDIDVDRTTTTEIKEVGTTKVTIPEAAQKKLS